MTEQQATDTQPQFQILKLYLKDASFEIPDGAKTFQADWKPEVNLQLNNTFTKLEEDNAYEIVLSINCDVKCNNTSAFVLEMQQAGIFSITNFDKSQLDHALNSFAPNILYPYAREVISDLVAKGGFPQLCLAPVNFDMLYQEQLQQQKETEVN